ncbi:MAG: FAD-binding protein [Actinobacteria bacterium]|nr:FAD-binding protein [Actinomycetota bacterium]
MAGLCAAARARELGADPVVFEKGDRPGGSMLLSSCVVWRYRSLEDFRAECPGGDPLLQELIVERLDEALAWLESLGAPVVWGETGNPRTIGKRFDPKGLTDVLVGAAGEIRLGEPLSETGEALLLATGGFQGDSELVKRHITGEPVLLRANPWSAGDGLRIGLARGAALSAGLDEFYGRAMPAPPARVPEEKFVELAQLYGSYALVLNEDGEEFAPDPISWAETDLVQAIARQPGGRAWYVVDDPTLDVRIRGRSVSEMIEAARDSGGAVLTAPELGFDLPDSYRYAVHVAAGITHTVGGLRVDDRARVLGADGAPIDGLFAAGVDVGGIAVGGYASGLAAALVLGLTAAEALSSL